ncbi:MAG TPA: DUF4416 family protein [bacterium]|nr:DUF4416 family protein [bacterium]
MGHPVQPQPVKLFTGVLCADPGIVDDVRHRLEKAWGAVDYTSPDFSFDLTNYYAPEMGTGIRRWFWSFHRLIDPGRLPDVKWFSNAVETAFSDARGRRRINLDPGYLDFYKMVLASVKDRAQKIYLSRGIYADPTLYYLKGRWYPYDWSLPDFKKGIYNAVFQEIRGLYRRDMREVSDGEVDYLRLEE